MRNVWSSVPITVSYVLLCSGATVEHMQSCPPPTITYLPPCFPLPVCGDTYVSGKVLLLCCTYICVQILKLQYSRQHRRVCSPLLLTTRGPGSWRRSRGIRGPRSAPSEYAARPPPADLRKECVSVFVHQEGRGIAGQGEKRGVFFIGRGG